MSHIRTKSESGRTNRTFKIPSDWQQWRIDSIELIYHSFDDLDQLQIEFSAGVFPVTIRLPFELLTKLSPPIHTKLKHTQTFLLRIPESVFSTSWFPRFEGTTLRVMGRKANITLNFSYVIHPEVSEPIKMPFKEYNWYKLKEAKSTELGSYPHAAFFISDSSQESVNIVFDNKETKESKCQQLKVDGSQQVSFLPIAFSDKSFDEKVTIGDISKYMEMVPWTQPGPREIQFLKPFTGTVIEVSHNVATFKDGHSCLKMCD